MQYSEAEKASEALEKVNGCIAVKSPNVSEKNDNLVSEAQLSFDLKACKQIETGKVASPSREDAIQDDFDFALKSLVERISKDVEAQKDVILALNSSRKVNIAFELENIISELSQFKTSKPMSSEKLNETMYASYQSAEGRSLRIFCSRVAYFLTLRLLLVHYWRALGLIPKDQKYQDSNLSINQVLNKQCSNLIADKHIWLFAKQNNYSWFKPTKSLYEEIEKILSYWEFKESSISILSKLYERYLDENCLQKYAHYTPPPLVQFIWDFLRDHSENTSLFRVLGNNRTPKLIFDPTMGSGNFLIEAAERMRSEMETSEQDSLKRLKETIQAYTTGLYGCDVDVFAHFFSEIKLLWKLSPLFKEAETLLPHQKLNTRLSIIHQNALKLYNQSQLDMMAPEEHIELSADARFGLPTFEGHLKKVHSQIRLLEKFDFCIGCPPERILNKQRELLKEIIKKMPYWKGFYQTNLLYSSWFFVLGLSKLREAGKLIFLTETYWPTEGGASHLRNTILKESRVLCIIDLGEIRLEMDTSPLPRYITLLEKCSSKEDRDQNKIKIIKVHPQKDKNIASFVLGKILNKARVVDRPGKLYTDEELDIYYSGVNQGELGEAPWQQMYDTGFSQILKEILSFKTTLNYFCKISENNTPEKDQMALITPETAEKNSFRIFTEKQKPKGNYFTLQLKPISKESPYYIMALLNSNVLNFWYANNGSKKNGKKHFEPAALKMIPVRPIDFGKPMDESLHKEKISQIDSAIVKFDEKYLMANINLELTHGREEIVHDAIELMQKEVLTIEKNLKRYDMFFYDNISTLSHANLCPMYNPYSFREIYPPDKQCYLKDHKSVYINTDNVTRLEQFSLTHFKRQDGIKNEGEHLILISKDNRIIKIYAQRELLNFIEDNLKQQLHNFWDEILGSILLPEDLDAFHAFKEDVIEHCLKLKDKQIKLIRIMNELIFKLYGFNVDDKDEEKAKLAQKSIDIMNGGQYIPSTSEVLPSEVSPSGVLKEAPEQTELAQLVAEDHKQPPPKPELSLDPPSATADAPSATPPS